MTCFSPLPVPSDETAGCSDLRKTAEAQESPDSIFLSSVNLDVAILQSELSRQHKAVEITTLALGMFNFS